MTESENHSGIRSEIEPKPFTFYDLSWNVFNEVWTEDQIRKGREEERSYGPAPMAFHFTPRGEGIKDPEPEIWMPINPFIPYGRTLVCVILLGVNKGFTQAVSIRQFEGGKKPDPRVFNPFADFDVYDFDITKIDDPNVTDDIKKIEPSRLVSAHDNIRASHSTGWVADEHARQRINEWLDITVNSKGEDPKAFGRRKIEIEKYVMLRQAPFNTSNVPAYGKYTYEGVIEEATRQYESRWNGHETVNEPVTFRMFEPEDVEWLETYMKNKGLPIPGK